MNTENYTINAIFEVEEDFSSGNRDYIINLSKQNFDQMCKGYVDFGCLFGRAENDVEFYIFQGLGDTPNKSKLEKADTTEGFKVMPDGDGYYIYFGAETAELKHNFIREDFDKATKKHYDNLENKIRTIGKIPITITGAQRELTLGYVTLKLEE
jgi:hypothetical protein